MNRSIGFIYKASTGTIRNNIKFATKISSLPTLNICNNNIFTTASASTTPAASTNTTSNCLPTFNNKTNSNNKLNIVNSKNINSNNVSSLLQLSSFGDDDGT